MSIDPERRLAEALRAQARGGGRPMGDRAGESMAQRARAETSRTGATEHPWERATGVRGEPERPPGMTIRTALLLALLGGGVLGTVLALLSLLAPGLLPALG